VEDLGGLRVIEAGVAEVAQQRVEGLQRRPGQEVVDRVAVR